MAAVAIAAVLALPPLADAARSVSTAVTTVDATTSAEATAGATVASTAGATASATAGSTIAATAASPQKAAARLAPWTGKLEAARASAKERNVPVLVHVILEDEEQNDEYRDKILPDKALIEACDNVIVIVANNGTHAKSSIDVEVDGKKVKREVCSLYPVEACSHHQAAWDELWREFKHDDGVLYCPQTIVFTPDGKVDSRLDTRSVPAATEVMAAIKAAQLKAGPGLTEAQLALVKRLLEEGRNLMKSKSWPDAWKTWLKVLAITPKSVYGDEAQKALPLAQQGASAELERMTALLVPGTAAEGWKQLTAFQQQCAGLPLEKEITARLKKVEGVKAIRDEIAVYKLSLEADALLKQAVELSDQKQEKRAEAVVRRLLGKRYGATPAARSARELWPAIAAEEDAKGRGGGK